MGFIKLRLTTLLLLLTTYVTAQDVDSDAVMYYKMWGSLEGRHEYQVAVFKLAMELTAPDYPPYVLTQNLQSFGSIRGRREVAYGQLINFYVSPLRAPSDHLYKELYAIPVPIMNGLLGYRKLVVHKDRVEKLAQVKTLEALKPLVVGQAKGWPDAEIYRHSGFAIDDNSSFSGLFSMLEKGRFDYLPLGIMEVERLLSQSNSNNLITMRGLYIYYPLPVVFQVSFKEKKLIERLEKGLKMAAENGEMQKLFEQHYADYINVLKNEDYHLFVLDNPRLETTLGLSKPLLSDPKKSLN